MKKTCVYWVVLFLVLTLTPLSALEAPAEGDTAAPTQTSDASAENPTEPEARAEPDVTPTEPPASSEADKPVEEVIDVYSSTEGTATSMKLRDYVIGVVAAEMPAVYEPEALEAQAAAAMNLARRAMLYDGVPAWDGAVITTDSAVHQAYHDVGTLRARWGTNFDAYYAKIAAAVEAVEPYKIVYDGALCMTAFHAISPGRTESAENIWSNPVDYLTPADSSFDSTAAGYESYVSVSAAEFAEGLAAYGFVSDGDPAGWLGESVRTDSGTLLALAVGGCTVSGEELRAAFRLRSAAVTVAYADGFFHMTVRGYGHGIGMSQYGAQQLALQGKTWQEIIQHYYTGAEIVPVGT